MTTTQMSALEKTTTWIQRMISFLKTTLKWILDNFNNGKQCISANLNINSLRNQFAEIKEMLVSNAFVILSVQETKIDRSFPNIQFHVNDYNLFLW